MENLQDLLIYKRNQLKLSLRNAAELIGISHSYLSILEKGTDARSNAPVRPTPETLQLISKAYGVSYGTLMKLAGYLEQAAESAQSESEPIDIENEIERFRMKFHENPEGFVLSGEPLSRSAMETILEAMEFGIRTARKLNQKA